MRCTTRLGGLSGAIASKADEVFGQLTKTEQPAVRQLFLQLIHPGDGAQAARRRVPLREISPDALRLVYKLTDARLLVTGRRDGAAEDSVEIAHETLIQNWDRLRSWLREDRDFLLWHNWLRTQVAISMDPNRNQDDAVLLRGALLSEAERWLVERPERLQQAR